MNANELAVELEHYLKGEEYDRLVWEIPDLLRQQQERLTKYELRHAEQRKRIDDFEHQQQAEIETYKLELYDEVMLRKEQKAEIEALKEGVEKLKDAYCQKDHEVKKAEQYCLDAFERGRQIGYADGMINRKAQEK